MLSKANYVVLRNIGVQVVIIVLNIRLNWINIVFICIKVLIKKRNEYL